MGFTQLQPEQLALLAEPFPADELEPKPQARTRDKTRAMAVLYAPIRAYHHRLNDVLGRGAWHPEYTALAQTGMKCRLWIGGEWFEATGEADPEDANQWTSAEAQSFKRACAFGLGLGDYLYDLPKDWYDYDDQKSAFLDPERVVTDILYKAGLVTGNIGARPRPERVERAGESAEGRSGGRIKPQATPAAAPAASYDDDDAAEGPLCEYHTDVVMLKGKYGYYCPVKVQPGDPAPRNKKGYCDHHVDLAAWPPKAAATAPAGPTGGRVRPPDAKPAAPGRPAAAAPAKPTAEPDPTAELFGTDPDQLNPTLPGIPAGFERSWALNRILELWHEESELGGRKPATERTINLNRLDDQALYRLGVAIADRIALLKQDRQAAA